MLSWAWDNWEEWLRNHGRTIRKMGERDCGGGRVNRRFRVSWESHSRKRASIKMRRSCWSVGRKAELEAKQLLAWGELSRYDYCELLISHFHIDLLSFSVVFLGIDLLIGVDIRGHSFALLNLLFICMLCFGFILVFLISLVNIWCFAPSVNLMYQNHTLVSFGFHLLLALWRSMT